MRVIILILLILMFARIEHIKSQSTGSTQQKTDNLVGTIPGSFGVSPSGAAIYSIPLDLPPGRVGMTPNISLVYNSQINGTILGQGWTLSGFSAITRTNPTTYYNGYYDNIDFEDDELLFDGAHLIKISENAGVIEYRKETDPSTKIECISGSYGQYFKVYTKGGLIIEYGNTNDSRLVYSENNPDLTPLAWHINKTSDRMGNNVIYHYFLDASVGELHPIDIYYTGFGDRTLGSTRIVFDYSTKLRSDLWKKSYFGINIPYVGEQPYLNTNSWRLEKIRITTDLDKPIKDYEIVFYEDEGLCKEFFVKDIILINYSNNAPYSINPTHFDWEFYSPDYKQQFKNTLPDYIKSFSQFHNISLDMTGNDKDEIAILKSKLEDPFDYLNFVRVITVYFDELLTSIDIQIVGFLYENEMHSIDWDMDGNDELLFVDSDGLKIYDYDLSTKTMVPVYSYLHQVKAFPGDFNGDGINDILIVSENSCQVLEGGYLPSNNTFEYTLNSHDLPIDKKEQIETVADFNGDGMLEILWRDAPDYIYKTYSFSSLNGFELIQSKFIAQNNTTITQAAYYNDFNGDGKTDICYLAERSYMPNFFSKETYFSYGNNFIDPISTQLIEGKPSMVEDFNNDGRADFISFSLRNNELFLGFRYTQPDGVNFSPRTYSLSVPIDVDNINDFFDMCTADIDGNGIRDFVFTFWKNFLINKDNNLTPSYGEIYVRPYVGLGIGRNVVQSITDGFGVKTQVNYVALDGAGISNCNFPITNSRSKDVVVYETYILGENNQKWDRKTYNFSLPLVHLQGKGFLGFMQTEVMSWQENLNTSTISDLLINNDKYYSLFPTKITTSSGNKLLSETLNTVEFKVSSPPDLRFVPVVTKSINRKWDNDDEHSYLGIAINNQNIADIDKYGNSTKSEVIKDEWSWIPEPTDYTWKKTVTTKFVEPDETHWIVGLPEITEWTTFHKVEEENTNPTNVNRINYHYLTSGGVLTPMVEYIESIPNNNITLLTQNWFTYDRYGNMTSDKRLVKINGLNEQRIVEYAYDENDGYDGRFLTSTTLKAEAVDEDQITKNSYDNQTGNMLTSTDEKNSLVTTYEYNNLGQLQKIGQPDNTSNEVIKDWSANVSEPTPPQNALYYTLSHKNLVGVTDKWGRTYTFYNKYGRPLREVTFSFTGDPIHVDSRYNDLGRVSQVSEPYLGSVAPTQWTSYEYDALGRIVNQILPTGANVQTSFKGRTTKVINSSTGVWKETTMNVIGKPDLIKDPTGGVINYNYDAASRLRSVILNGTKTLSDYDDAGNQIKLTDPDAGVTEYTYNGFGELITQKDARNNVQTMEYDKLGRLISKKLMPDNETTLYSYEKTATNNGFGQLLSITITSGNGDIIKTGFTFDHLSRVQTKTESIDEKDLSFAYSYSNTTGMLETYTFPTGYQVNYLYNNYGYLSHVVNFSNGIETNLWRGTGTNARGQVTGFELGNGQVTNKEYDTFGYPKRIYTKNMNDYSVQDLNYSFQSVTGNLTRKWEILGSTYLSEGYEYDPELKTRLTSWQVDGGTKYTIQYANNGNIETKSDVTQSVGGQYTYEASAGPHAVTGITNPTSDYLANAPFQSVQYNGINKVKYISPGFDGENLEIKYGTNNQRIKSYTFTWLKSFDTPIQTKYYFGDFEIEVDHRTNKTRYLHYLSAGSGLFAIIEIKDNTTTPYYIHTDYLGNFNVITDSKGSRLEVLSFDPWGRRRNPTNWSFIGVPRTYLFDRGYTGHEHLDRFGLINMNGRVYDPCVARFLSPDPFIQSPGNSQSYNRYSYVLNNPLKYSDPSGYHPAPIEDNYVNPFASGGFRGLIGPGSGNHWSDSFRSEQGNYMLMSSSTFNNINGEGASDIAGALNSNATTLQWWQQGAISISQTSLVTAEVFETKTTWANYNGTNENPYQTFLGYDVTYGYMIEYHVVSGGGGTTGNPVKTISNTNDGVGIVITAAGEILQNTKAGADFVYLISGNSRILNGVSNTFKYSPYVGLFVTTGTGVLLSSNTDPATGQLYQSWTKTGIDIGANIGIIYIGAQYGGWYGAVAATLYIGIKYLYEHQPNEENVNLNIMCFSEGSLVVMGDRRLKKIDSIQVGDSILTYNFAKKEIEINPVLKIDNPVHHQLIKIIFNNGIEIISTEDHPYYVDNKGWCSFSPAKTYNNYKMTVGKLETSDFCLLINGDSLKKVKVEKIVSYESKIRTYNLTKIANSNNYFVNGILVNNESETK